MTRSGIAWQMPAAHPRKTLAAQRLLAATPDLQRPQLTHQLFKAYWQVRGPASVSFHHL